MYTLGKIKYVRESVYMHDGYVLFLELADQVSGWRRAGDGCMHLVLKFPGLGCVQQANLNVLSTPVRLIFLDVPG